MTNYKKLSQDFHKAQYFIGGSQHHIFFTCTYFTNVCNIQLPLVGINNIYSLLLCFTNECTIQLPLVEVNTLYVTYFTNCKIQLALGGDTVNFTLQDTSSC